MKPTYYKVTMCYEPSKEQVDDGQSFEGELNWCGDSGISIIEIEKITKEEAGG